MYDLFETLDLITSKRPNRSDNLDTKKAEMPVSLPWLVPLMKYTQHYAFHHAQQYFEEIETMRGLLLRGGRPLPPLPEDFTAMAMAKSHEAHCKALTALQSVLEVMDDQADAQTLLRDIWSHLVQSTKRGQIIFG